MEISPNMTVTCIVPWQRVQNVYILDIKIAACCWIVSDTPPTVPLLPLQRTSNHQATNRHGPRGKKQNTLKTTTLQYAHENIEPSESDSKAP